MNYYLNNQDEVILREIPQKENIHINIPTKYIDYNCGTINIKEFLLNILTNKDPIGLIYEPKYIVVTPKEAIQLILDNHGFSANEKIKKIHKWLKLINE